MTYRLLGASLCAVAAIAFGRGEARPGGAMETGLSAAASFRGGSPEDTAAALHLLRRATWGPRPEDLQEVLRVGTGRWLERQLHPERIPDDALGPRLARFPAAQLTPEQLSVRFPQPRPGDSTRTRAPEASPAQMLTELTGARLARAVHTERQLEDVMTDFWFNHFNVFAGKGLDRWLVSDYERNAIRPHVFGKFRDLLGATAHHPAMLVYLDNWRSISVDSTRPQPRNVRRPRGLNENYARELMELHTLGVDAGYTQTDVIEVARAFTGWSMVRPRPGHPSEFVFHPENHDRREKVVLGQRLPAGRGMEDGEAVLDLLARHPATARRIATRLAQRFVADEPPADLVDRLAEVFTRTDGDLREVTRALFLSPEFEQSRERAAKVRTPLEFVTAAMRATGAEVMPSQAVLATLRRMGQLPYMETAPTGYPHTRDEWTSAGAMLSRMDFARSLAMGRVDGIAADERLLTDLPADPRALALALGSRVLPGSPLPPAVVGAVTDAVASEQGNVRRRRQRALGLLLGSPTFQRR